ncbi:MAG: oligosaccharide flippase family protein [Cyclobacteriaceae bacterium]
MSFIRNIVKHFTISASFEYTSQLVRFLATIVLSRLLSPAEYGVIALIQVFSSLVMLLRDSGFSFAIIREDYSQDFKNKLHFISILIGLLLCLVFMLFSVPISVFYANEDLVAPSIAIAVTFLISSFTVVPFSILRKELKFSLLGQIRLLANITAVGLAIILAFSGFSYWALVIQEIIYYSAVAIFATRRSSIIFKIYGFSEMRNVLKSQTSLMKYILSSNVVIYFARNWDNALVGKIYGESSLGIYSRAYLFINLVVTQLSTLASQVAFPNLVRVTETEQIRSQLLTLSRLLALVSLPIGMLLILLPSELCRLLWGVDWLAVADFLPFVGLVIFVQAQLSPFANFLLIHRRDRAYFRLIFITSFFTIVGVSIGAYFSFLAMMRIYSLVTIVLTLLINLYVVGFRVLNIEIKVLIRNWGLIISSLLGIYLGILLGWNYLLIFSTVVYSIWVFVLNWAFLDQGCRNLIRLFIKH